MADRTMHHEPQLLKLTTHFMPCFMSSNRRCILPPPDAPPHLVDYRTPLVRAVPKRSSPIARHQLTNVLRLKQRVDKWAKGTRSVGSLFKPHPNGRVNLLSCTP